MSFDNPETTPKEASDYEQPQDYTYQHVIRQLLDPVTTVADVERVLEHATALSVSDFSEQYPDGVYVYEMEYDTLTRRDKLVRSAMALNESATSVHFRGYDDNEDAGIVTLFLTIA